MNLLLSYLTDILDAETFENISDVVDNRAGELAPAVRDMLDRTLPEYLYLTDAGELVSWLAPEEQPAKVIGRSEMKHALLGDL